MKKVLVMLGPNLNMVGIREKGIYGEESAESINNDIKSWAEELSLSCTIFQSNWEGALIDQLHEARETFDGVVLNAGALTHYSYALRDAIAAIKIPVIEIHMSNVFAREEFRHHSVISPVCAGTIAGFGKYGYQYSLLALKQLMKG